MKDGCKCNTHWSGSILKATYTNLTDQCSWQLKFRHDVSLGIVDFLSVRISELTLPNTEIFELHGPDNIKADSQIPFTFLFIHLGSQVNSFTKLRLPSAMETGEISSFLWIFYACQSTVFMMSINQARGADGLQKKPHLLNATRNGSKREALILCYPSHNACLIYWGSNIRYSDHF